MAYTRYSIYAVARKKTFLTRKLCYCKDYRTMRLIYELYEFWLGVVNANIGEVEIVGGRGWYHSKERW